MSPVERTGARRAPAARGAQLVAAGAGRLRVEGDLDFGTVAGLLAQGEAMIPRSGQIEIDLGGVESANSAGLALLLEWVDLSRARRVDLRYLGLPDALARIADLSNLRSLLPVEPARPAAASSPEPRRTPD